MRTCANVVHGLGRGGGYEPLPEAGEYVCDCYEHGTGEPWAHVGRGSKACPARKIMKGHPDDAACGHMFRKGRCCQFERRPERRRK